MLKKQTPCRELNDAAWESADIGLKSSADFFGLFRWQRSQCRGVCRLAVKLGGVEMMAEDVRMPMERRGNPLTWMLFRPWRWPRWLLGTLLISAPVFYFLSAIPVVRIAEEHSRSKSSVLWIERFYLPVALCLEHSAIAQAVAEWESRQMDRIYGPPGVTTDSIMDAIRAF